MTTTQHTPGPWNFKKITQGSLKDNYAIGGHWLDELGCEHEGFIGTSIREANARLIAAAPELLEACIASHTSKTQAELNRAVELIAAAINKATGA